VARGGVIQVIGRLGQSLASPPSRSRTAYAIHGSGLLASALIHTPPRHPPGEHHGARSERCSRVP